MNKVELEAKIAASTGVDKKSVGKVVDAFLAAMIDSLKTNDSVRLVNFGTFQVRERAARQGKNPANGEKIEIPASKRVTFKAGKALKDAVN